MGTDRRAATEEFAFIDALRGLAAVAVFFYHAFVHVLWVDPAAAEGTPAWRLVHHDFNWGRYAVSVFFLVSGFLIPATLRKPGAALRTFAVHRAFRLYPAYWLSIAAFAAYHLLTGGGLGAPPRDVLVNLTMGQKFVGVPDYIGAFWTLQIELIFYAACAALFAVGWLDCRRTALVLACAAMVAAGWARGATGRNVPVAVPLALSLMAFADLVRAYHRGGCGGRELAGWTAVVGGCLVPTCLLAYGDFGPGAVLSNWAAVATFLAADAARGAFARPGVARAVGRFFGDISYSFYLFGSSLGLEAAGWVSRETGSFPAAVAAGFAVTTLLSLLSWRLVERPGIRLGRTLAPTRP